MQRKRITKANFPYYDWAKTLSYNAPITLVVGERGRGKTFGIRKKAIEICIEQGKTYVELTRYQNDIDGDGGISNGYFDKLQEKGYFLDYHFKVEKGKAYWQRIDDENEEWHLLIYFLAMTKHQQYKTNTFANVRFIIFDEFIIERVDRFHTYLKGEFYILSSLINTILRQDRFASKHPNCNVIMMGNALDMVNPYFSNIGLERMPSFGYHWYKNKLYLLHYVEPDQYTTNMLDNTIAGRMIAGTAAADSTFYNVFEQDSDRFIEGKSSKAVYEFGFEYDGNEFGVWLDYKQGIAYVCSTALSDRLCFALTDSERKISQIQIKRSNSYMQNLLQMYELGYCRFESPKVRETFITAMRLFGLR